MKKFMTVLLVVAVMFTFSFGSAFAVENTQGQYLSNLADAEAKVLKTLEGEYAMAKATVTYNDEETVGGYAIAGALWLEQLEEVYADAIEAVKAQTVAAQTADMYNLHGDKTVDQLAALYTVANEAALRTALYDAAGEYAAAAAKVQFADDKAEFIANANSVDTSIYSETEQDAAYPAVVYGETTVETKVPKAYADAKVAAVVYALEQVKLADADDTVAEIYAKASLLSLGEIQYDAVKKVYYLDETLVDILSKTEEAVAGAQDSATKSSKIASLAAKVSEAAANPTVIAFNDEQLAAWTALKDAYVAVETYLINNVDAHVVNNFPGYTVTKVEGVYKANETATHYQEAVKDMADVEATAVAKKAEVTAAGDAAYDAAEVDKLLTAAYKAQYAKAPQAAAYVKSAETFEAAKYAYSTEFAKLSAKAKVEEKVDAEAMEFDGVAYYALEWAKVEEAVAAFNAAVEAAATTPEITKAENDFATAMGKIDDATDVDKLFKSGVCKASAVAAKKEIDKYIAALNADKEAADKVVAPTQDELNKWYAEQNARTEKEVKALYADALAWAAAGETAGEIEAASKGAVAAVEAAIDALPTALNATLADAEAAAAAKEAYDALTAAEKAEVAVAKNSKLTALLENLQTLAQKDITAKIEAINKDGITAADAEAFVALEEAVELYESVGGTNTTGADFIAAKEAALKAAEKKAVIDAIDALPTEITAADREAVEAARAAYEAYVAKYTDYAAGIDATKDITNVTALLMAEAALPVFDDADAKAYVQDLKIVARSVKTAKGNVKVTINADVEELIENGYTVEYKFYRSEKARAKYGTAKKVSESNVYTNTAGKKGVQYFYKAKLVVKNAEGEVVATTPLTQCKYATRVWSK